VTAGQKLLLSIRPEALRLAQGYESAVLRARLVLREFLGQIQRLHARLPDGTQIRASLLGGLQVSATAGSEVAFAYDPAQIIIYPEP
jgi:hypothetical protein